MKNNIIKDQEAFFNQSSLHEISASSKNDIFSKYANKEQVLGFKWLSNSKKILDYGCGTGTSIDVFLKHRNRNKYMIYGVDIAGMALKKARKKYPKYKFYKIENNKIPQLKNNSMDGAYLLHVLHHAKNHQDIFKTLHSKLKINGKFLINDLSSNNPINKAGRAAFTHMPSFIKNGFNDDLVVGENIPDKYKVDVRKVIAQLEKTGFIIEKVGHGHLFFFIFAWIDKFLPFTKIALIKSFYTQLIKLEDYLLRFSFFQNKTEVFYIKCLKK